MAGAWPATGLVEATATVARLKARYVGDTRWLTLASTEIAEDQGCESKRALQCDLVHAWLVPEDFRLAADTSLALSDPQIDRLKRALAARARCRALADARTSAASRLARLRAGADARRTLCPVHGRALRRVRIRLKAGCSCLHA